MLKDLEGGAGGGCFLPPSLLLLSAHYLPPSLPHPTPLYPQFTPPLLILHQTQSTKPSVSILSPKLRGESKLRGTPHPRNSWRLSRPSAAWLHGAPNLQFSVYSQRLFCSIPSHLQAVRRGRERGFGYTPPPPIMIFRREGISLGEANCKGGWRGGGHGWTQAQRSP